MNAHEDDDAEAEGVYIISVAARILEMHPQTLRKYERVGLISPFRTVGVRRLYSDEDIARLRLIKHLVGDLGLNLAGVQLVLDVFNELLALRSKTIELEGTDLNAHLRKSLDTLFTLLYTGQTEPDDDTD
ncbi:MAG: MerR family transcriptional regulator [Chloroflexi bacterium]|nr:MerR family transcriptional regulator [Chloroflexota bacterium]